MARHLRAQIKAGFEEAGIETPFPSAWSGIAPTAGDLPGRCQGASVTAATGQMGLWGLIAAQASRAERLALARRRAAILSAGADAAQKGV